jgi:hypothetical protein
MREVRNAYTILVGKYETERDHSEDPAEDKRKDNIELGYQKTGERMGIGFILPRVRTVARLWEHDSEYFGGFLNSLSDC